MLMMIAWIVKVMLMMIVRIDNDGDDGVNNYDGDDDDYGGIMLSIMHINLMYMILWWYPNLPVIAGSRQTISYVMILDPNNKNKIIF